MLRCVIVDDEELGRARVRRLLARAEGFCVTGDFADAATALPALAADRPDLLFLDVHMPEMDGFELLAALPDAAVPHVIFVTAHDAYAVRAFERHALDYLLKPFTAARFHAALAHARTHLAAGGQAAEVRRLLESVQDRGAGRLAVRSSSGVRLIRSEDIDWIEAADNYAQLHAGGQSFLVRERMDALAERLGARFARVHRRAIVNLDRVRELQPLFAGDWLIILDSGARLRLSRTYRQRVHERLGLGPA